MELLSGHPQLQTTSPRQGFKIASFTWGSDRKLRLQSFRFCHYYGEKVNPELWICVQRSTFVSEQRRKCPFSNFCRPENFEKNIFFQLFFSQFSEKISRETAILLTFSRPKGEKRQIRTLMVTLRCKNEEKTKYPGKLISSEGINGCISMFSCDFWDRYNPPRGGAHCVSPTSM